MWNYRENIVIKIDIDFNLNVLLKLFFSLSKILIFFSPILANNNLPLKIYCESIVKILWYHFPFLFFFLFFPSFFILHTCTAFLFSFFFLLHTRTLTLFFFYFFPFLQPTTSSKLRTFQPSFFLFFFFFFFFVSFSLSTSFVPLLKIYPYSFLFFPSFLFFSFTLFCSLFFWERSIDSQSSPLVILPLLIFFFPFLLAHRL